MVVKLLRKSFIKIDCYNTNPTNQHELISGIFGY